ncbi:Bug family tripartite tricarboxylate transporter substrate binding protein [Aquabacterium sp. J223]|uniref:Bug family tripartite tricarboxylate transporter substrate binding protein n=1 Tax=Aquabacterium sp. J223 TaxID=2898431 RepID=UPI0021ADF0F6|nr:tripartite tricarboxylate transporter substrate binding protein [Aquabacterium sp. J223]UUX97267.1 tripartite tricarboxylate transporter substrate binding protein [Aquabacterium sp. J223]
MRAIAEGLAGELGRTIVVENRGGAGGLTAASHVGRSPADDGSLLLYGNQGQVLIARHLLPGNDTDPQALLVPVALTVRTQFLLVVPADSPFKSVADVAAAARARPLQFGVPGIGTPPHLATLLLGEATGSKPQVVPYQGSAPALVDLIAGRLDASFDNVASSLEHVRAGRLRALGISSRTRSPAVPEVPPIADGGVEGYAFQAWQGLFAPKATTERTLQALEDATLRSLRSHTVRQRLEGLGLEVAAQGRAEFQALIAQESRFWEAMVRKGLFKTG